MRRLLVLLLAVAAALAAGGLAGGTHWMPEHYTWTDLTATGDRHISYLLCGIPYDLPPEWQQGVENWDVAMSSVMEFDLQSGGCFDSADTWLAWEAQNECVFWNVPSCWAPVTWHQQATWRELQLTIVYFDHDIYYDLGQWEDAWQTAVSAHEWGHNLNLEDHSTDQCSQPNLIMGQGDVSHPPCLTGPTWAEADSVAQFYGYWGDGDPDLDGFSNDVENYVGTGPRDNCSDNPNDAAWPPDITNDRNCDVSDVLQYPPHLNSMCGEGAYWRRLDLSTDCAVDVSDVLALLPYLNTSCQ